MDEVADRTTFLQCVRNGVSAYQRQPGGESFTNHLPVNIAAQNAEVQADLVLCIDVLEHVSHPDALLAQIVDRVKVGGDPGNPVPLQTAIIPEGMDAIEASRLYKAALGSASK